MCEQEHDESGAQHDDASCRITGNTDISWNRVQTARLSCTGSASGKKLHQPVDAD